MTTRPDRALIELSFISNETAAVIGLRFGRSSKAVYSIWKRAKEANRLPKIARKIGKRRRG